MNDLACDNCGVTGVRLWREYGKFSPEKRCRTCLPLEARSRLDQHDPTQAGWWVAAVPDDDGHFWGYTSIPQDALVRWMAMPG